MPKKARTTKRRPGRPKKIEKVDLKTVSFRITPAMDAYLSSHEGQSKTDVLFAILRNEMESRRPGRR